VWMNDHIITKIWDLGDGEAVFRAETQGGDVVLSHAHATYGG
jgi:hypothetical protein